MKPLRWVAAVAILIFGIFSVGNWTSPIWVAVTLALYAMPLLMQLFRHETIRAYALWFGVILIVQTLITPVVIDRNYRTLPPNMVRTIDVIGDEMPGISGIQQITTDGKGYRVTRPIDYSAKTKDAFRVVAIGGSTTEQIVLDNKRTWTHLLQERLSASDGFGTVEVINVGVSGTRAIHHLSTLKRALAPQPDLIIFLMGISDWNHHIWQQLGAPRRYGPEVSSTAIQFSESLIGLVLKGLFEQSQVGEEEGVQDENSEYFPSQKDSLNRPTVKSFRPETVSEEYRAAVDEIGVICRTSGVSCMFATQPSAYQKGSPDDLKKYLWMTPPNTGYTLDFPSLIHIAETYNSYLLDFAGENGFAHCDLANMFEATLDHLYDDCHFNFGGAVHAADLLTACIVQSD